MEYSALDIVLLAPIVFGIIKGFMKGFIRELAAILGIFIGIVAAYLLADNVFKYFTIYFESVDFELKIISYVVVFFGTILLVNSLASLMTRTMKLIALNGINRLMGAVFGAVKWAMIVTLAVFSLNKIQQNNTIFQKSTLKQSQVYQRFLGYSEEIAKAVGFDDLVDKQYLIKDAD
ncbi:CvpA family protein [Croceimicrobium hydrocarbonivorans]|uniref:CvpA family protein n=1 Tax=Croceimicrobium hydrocarbonivorans TaxID=2761580 RepID=A0A7H0VJF4_9FLAO|nr:CvpA family protein [Croceimicrobium hydrocarbonivorans]QNR25852.1 CvpA family protein [Croceimicrobium hydrocarbonivorans]